MQYVTSHSSPVVDITEGSINSVYAIRWILLIIHEYVAAAVCRDFLVTPLEARVLSVDFSNLQDIFIITKS